MSDFGFVIVLSFCYNGIYKQKERWQLMPANILTVSDLLTGQVYRSKTLEGTILNAQPHPKDVWYGRDVQSYLVEVKPFGKLQTTYRTMAIAKP
jgi:hypothetical protein